MKVTLPENQELSEDWKTARDQIRRQLEQMAAAINSSWDQEHTADGSHGDIVADSLELQDARVGEWVELVYEATRFSGEPGLTVTVPENTVYIFRYMRIGQLILLQFHFSGTIGGSAGEGTASDVRVKLPELHALPLKSGTSGGFQSCGTFLWENLAATLPQGFSQTLITSYVMTEAVPNTTLNLTKFDASSASGTGVTGWVNGDFGVQGFALFCSEPSNAANPFYGV